MTDDQFSELGKQLSHPLGAAGLELAEIMHETNIGMTTSAIDALNIRNENKVLELGHGNCGHLEVVLARAHELRYYGLEISDDMHREAGRRNKSRVASGAAQFDLYDGITIPFESAMFDRIMTINTVYFWNDQPAMCGEIARVLKPGGSLAIVFAQKSFMEDLPFTREHFHLVDTEDVIHMMKSAGLAIMSVTDKTEKVKTKAGDLVDRAFTVVLGQKD